MNRPAKTLPYRAYYLTLVLLSIAGVVNSLYLSYLHYKNYTDPTYASFCALSRAINCDTVAQSPWSVMFGVPVAIWGVFGYLLFFILLIPLRKNRSEVLRLWSLLVVLGAGYAIAAIYFGYISAVKVNSHCILCLLTYCINFGLFFGSWLTRRRFNTAPLTDDISTSLQIVQRLKWLSGTLVLFSGLFILVIVLLPPYWAFSTIKITANLQQGVTEDGYPWIGAENPILTIHEYSDYMCFQCKKMHFFLRQFVAQYPDQIRLVHRHFPMDRQYNPLVAEEYHSGAGKMALIALYAQEKGQFWKVNDFLFELAAQKQNFNTRDIARLMRVNKAEVVAALENRYLRLRLKHDIAVGIEQGISGTPAFVIDDHTYLGMIPKHIFQQLVAGSEK